jgi:hypothetical protein
MVEKMYNVVAVVTLTNQMFAFPLLRLWGYFGAYVLVTTFLWG